MEHSGAPGSADEARPAAKPYVWFLLGGIVWAHAMFHLLPRLRECDYIPAVWWIPCASLFLLAFILLPGCPAFEALNTRRPGRCAALFVWLFVIDFVIAVPTAIRLNVVEESTLTGVPVFVTNWAGIAAESLVAIVILTTFSIRILRKRRTPP